MPRFLITLSLGPVQSLIADARRTRDLWCGSWLLSEAARAAARALHERHPGCLIFPCPDNPDEDLKPQDTPREAANTANILRADAPLSNRTEVLALCDEAKRAAALRVQNLGERARRLLGVPVREEVWRTQVDDILESFAAWVEIADGDDGYPAAGQRLGAAPERPQGHPQFPAVPAVDRPGTAEVVARRCARDRAAALARGRTRPPEAPPVAGRTARRSRRHQASGRRRGAIHRPATHRRGFLDRAPHVPPAATTAGSVRATGQSWSRDPRPGKCRHLCRAAVRQPSPVPVPARERPGARA